MNKVLKFSIILSTITIVIGWLIFGSPLIIPKLESLWYVWIIPAPFISYFFVAYLKHRKNFEQKDFSNVFANKSKYFQTKIIFQITTKDFPKVVDDVVKRIHEVCAGIGYSNYQVRVVTDASSNRSPVKADIVLVPQSFHARYAKHKSRSLCYEIEQRKALGLNTSDYWIFHLDEESFITQQGLLSVLKYLVDSPTDISEGPIIYPHRLRELPLLPRYSENLRAYICHDCVGQMKGQMPTHMHGSNLVVRADVEDKIGWDFKGVVASEDQRFGHEASRLGCSFGWHGGTIEEQPPLTIKSWIRQRQRWFVGNMHNLVYGSISKRKKVTVLSRWASCGLGFVAGIVSIIALFVFQNIAPAIHYAFFVIMGVWLFGYQQGLYLNIRPLKMTLWERFKMHLTCLVTCPVVGLIETYAAFTAPLKLYRWTWVPTEK